MEMISFVFFISLFFEEAIAQMWPPIMPINYPRRSPMGYQPNGMIGQPFAQPIMPSGMPTFGQMPPPPPGYGFGGMGAPPPSMNDRSLSMMRHPINGIPQGLGAGRMQPPPFSMDSLPYSQGASNDGLGEDLHVRFRSSSTMNGLNSIQSLPSLPDQIPAQTLMAHQGLPTVRARSPSLPKFLDGASDDLINQYKSIIRKQNATYSEKVKEIEQLVVGKLDEDHQRLFHEFMSENDQLEQKHRDDIHKVVGNMSTDAQTQFAKISALLRNPELPDNQRWNSVLEVYNRMDTKLKNEFDEKFKPLVQQ